MSRGLLVGLLGLGALATGGAVVVYRNRAKLLGSSSPTRPGGVLSELPLSEVTPAVIGAAYPLSTPIASRIIDLAKELGPDVDPRWIANVIDFESGHTWDPKVKNAVLGATGIIQFIPSTARALGTTTDELAGMTLMQQFDYVEKYFKPYAGKLHSQLDVFMTVFYPKAIGKGRDYAFDEKVQAANPGIKVAGDYEKFALKHAKLVA